jgi:hypothetical protein
LPTFLRNRSCKYAQTDFKKKTAREVFSCDEADKNGSVLEGICKSVRNAKGRFKRERQWKAEKFRACLPLLI